MAALRDAGLTRLIGVAPGPANGFTLDVIDCLERFGDRIDWAMLILNPLEPWPGELALPAARAADVKVIARVVDYGGLFHDDVLPGHEFARGDHRGFRPPGWVEAGRERMDRLRPFADRHGLTMLQLACQWDLAQAPVSCVAPTLIQEAGRRCQAGRGQARGARRGAFVEWCCPPTRSPRSARSATTTAAWPSRARCRTSRAKSAPTAGR